MRGLSPLDPLLPFVFENFPWLLRRENRVAADNFRNADARPPALHTRFGNTSERRTSVVKLVENGDATIVDELSVKEPSDRIVWRRDMSEIRNEYSSVNSSFANNALETSSTPCFPPLLSSSRCFFVDK
jgi:hypothetical protein